MTKQTAIDWLVDQIKSVENQKTLSPQDWLQVIKKAKAKEKEQILEVFLDGYKSHPYMAEQYYNEIYGGNK